MNTASTFENNSDVSGAQPEKETESKLVIYLLHRLLRKWWLFLLIGIVAGIGGIWYASEQKPVYESYLTFALDEGGSEGGMSGAMGLAAQFGISLGGAKDVFTGDNILEIMLSRRIIERVLISVDTFDNKQYTLIEYFLQKLSINNVKLKAANIHFLPGELKNQFSYAKDSVLYNTVLEFEKQYISARRPNKKLNIYEVGVTSFDEQFTKKFTDKLISETNNFYIEISSKKARETLEILEQRVPKMKDKLSESISNKAAAADANLNPVFAEAQVPILKEQANAQVYGTAYAEMFKNLEMARFQYLKSIPLMQIIDPADYPMKKTKIGKLKTGIVFSVTAVFIAVIIFLFFNLLKNSRNSS